MAYQDGTVPGQFSRVVRTVVGKAVHAPGRQPIIPVERTGLGAANTANVPAVTIRNPFQREVPRVVGPRVGP